ncbi:MAG: class I SAM-dependent methyltransferase [Candidatus Limnocylindria bacterium]
MSGAGPDDQKTADDSPVGLYLAIGTEGEPELIHSVIPPGADVLDLGCGVGRIAHALIRLGHPVVGVDESAEMLAHVRGAETARSKIEDLDLRRTFGCVLLMSNLVNTGDPERCAAFLRTCRHHVAPDGVVLIERYDPKLSVREGTWDGAYGGVKVTVERRGEGGTAYAKITYTHPDGRQWTQEGVGTPRVLNDARMRAALAEADLELSRIFGPKRRWILARPA